MRRSAAVLAALLVTVLAAAPGARAVDELPVNMFFKSLHQSGWVYSQADAISETGVIGGKFLDSGGITRGFVREGKVHTTVHPTGWEISQVRDISGGIVLGYGRDASSAAKAFIYQNGTFTTFLPAGFAGINAMAVNSSGHFVGYETTLGGAVGYVYSGGSFMPIDFGGPTQTRMLDINDSDIAVGYYSDSGVNTAIRFDGTTLTDPAPSGWTNTTAGKINNRGDILGTGNDGMSDRYWLYSGGTYTTLSHPAYAQVLGLALSENGAVYGIAVSWSGAVAQMIYRSGEYYFYQDNPANYFVGYGFNSSGQVVGKRLPDQLAEIGYVLPTTRVSANGEYGAVSVSAAGPLTIRSSLWSWWWNGRPADWWLIAQTPTGYYSFDVASRTWKPGFFASANYPLRDLNGLKVPGAGSTPGVYTYYFGVDLKPNGVLDFNWWLYSRVTVFAR